MCWINEDSILISNLLTRISLWFHVVRLLSCHIVETREESNLFLPDLYLLEPELFPKYHLLPAFSVSGCKYHSIDESLYLPLV